MGDESLTEEETAESRPSIPARKYVVRGGRIVEVIVGPLRETR